MPVGDGLALARIPAPDFLMGEVFHTETRAYLIGPTGLGKTNFGMALAAAMAAGTDFLHWKRSGKSRKVLYIDGEMGQRLMVQRIQDVVRRLGSTPDGLSVLCRANCRRETAAAQHRGRPALHRGRHRPARRRRLHSVRQPAGPGHRQPARGRALRRRADLGKDADRRSIGQVWVHHTGLDETRGYGDKSKEWQFDTVLLLKRAGEDGEVAFDLEFTKARERTPDNRADFLPVRVELADDAWTVESTQRTRRARLHRRGRKHSMVRSPMPCASPPPPA